MESARLIEQTFSMEEQVYGYRVADTVFDQGVSIYLYYDPDKTSHDIKTFYEMLARTETELKAMKGTALRRKKYQNYFNIDIQNEQSFTYKRDSQAIDDYLKHCGYYMLMSTGPDFSRVKHSSVIEKRIWLKNNFIN